MLSSSMRACSTVMDTPGDGARYRLRLPPSGCEDDLRALTRLMASSHSPECKSSCVVEKPRLVSVAQQVRTFILCA